MEYTQKGRHSNSSRRQHQKFLKRWVADGCPKHYRIDQDGNRIWDIPAMREKLRMRNETHEDKMARLLKAECDLRLRRLNR